MTHNAPGKHYRQGVYLRQILKIFPDSETAEKWFTKRRWKGRAACVRCGSKNVQTGAAHKTMPYRCRDCRKRFSAKMGTVMEGSNLDYQVWAIAIYLMLINIKGVSSMKLHRDLEITQKSAWHLANRLRKAWEADGGSFLGPVEVDETYMGGKRANMSNAKRKALEEFGAGRGADVKTVKHSVREYVNGMAHTNGIESFWPLLKRGYHGIYYKMGPQHLNRYVTEFVACHNQRKLNTLEQIDDLAESMVGVRLKYDELRFGGAVAE